MNFEWIAISFSDVLCLGMAFAFGLLSRSAGLPPLVGFLAAGFILNSLGATNQELFQKLADLGITLLLFTVGLKINIRTLIRPEVWAVTTLHTCLTIVAFGLMFYGLAILGVPLFSDLTVGTSLLIAFALSFSSTVFVVKVLEQRGGMKSLHGRLAVGILIIQDIAAVVFLAISSNKWPSIWALLLLLLIFTRPLLNKILEHVGHGELQVIFGLLLAMGGAELFEIAGMKGDLGALVAGLLIASHAKADEMAKTMLGFKDLFLLGFFLSIGLSGQLSLQTVMIGILITPVVFFKSIAFFTLFTKFKLRARTALMATLSLSNYSEFGLIVVAIGVANGWVDNDWLIIIAAAMSVSFALSALFNSKSEEIFTRYRSYLENKQRPERLPDDRVLNTGDATIAIIGMGGVGTSAYTEMRLRYGDTVVGIDIDPMTVKAHQTEGRNVLLGDPGDSDFWDRIQKEHTLQTVLLALPRLESTLAVVHQLKNAVFNGQVAATSKFADEAKQLEQAGVSTVFNIYTEAGTGFATHVASFVDASA